MCFLYKWIRSSIRNNFFLIFGLVLGIGLSAFMSQLVQNNCIFSTQISYASKFERSGLIEDDDYEPVINLAGKPSKAQKTPQDFPRPRYYRTELGIREKLFAAILTSPKTFHSHGIPFNATTNSIFDKIVFFTESDSNKAKNDLKRNGMVQFSDMRLILKPFHMLKYIADNYLVDYDYFFIVRDTTYVRGRHLQNLVQSISISENVHAGNKKADELVSFCTLDAGILLSNSVLRNVTQNLDWCVKNAFSDSDDANLGRCIVHSSGLPCTDGSQGLKLHTFQFNENMKDLEFDRLEKNEGFTKALTLWPMSNPEMMYKLHIYFSKIDLGRTNLEIASIRHAKLNMTVILPNNSTVNSSWPVGNQPPNTPNNRFDLLRWDYFNEKQIFLRSDFSNVDDLEGADLIDIQYVINASVLYMGNKYDNQLQYKRFLNGYRRFDPSRGLDYIIDLAFKDVSTGRETHRRLEICKPLGKVELIPVPYVTENTRINMIVAVDENNKAEVLKFMENYATVCMEKRDKTHLMLVLLYQANHPGKGNKDDIYADVKKQAMKHSDRFKKDGNKIAWLSIKLPDERFFNLKRTDDKIIGVNQGVLNVAILDLATKKLAGDSLILFCTSNMEIRQDYLNRVRMNTIKEWQVFSPIPFVEFNPIIVYNEDLVRPKELDINRNYGHYDDLDTDHISFYVKDYRTARKKIEDLIPIIYADKDLSLLPQYFLKQVDKLKRSKDFHLGKIYNINSGADNLDPYISELIEFSLNSVYGMFIAHGNNLTVLRAVEPGLRLRHKEKDCSKVASVDDLLKSVLYQQCVERRNFNAGTRSHLGHFILEFLNDTNNAV